VEGLTLPLITVKGFTGADKLRGDDKEK